MSEMFHRPTWMTSCRSRASAHAASSRSAVVSAPTSSASTGSNAPTPPASSRSRAFFRARRGISRATEPRDTNNRASSTLLRWLKFNFVGGIGIGVQFAALFLLKSVLNFDYMFATALAVEAAVVHNFVWHEQFTWSDRVQPSWRRSLARFARFNVTTGAVSIVGNLALMRVLVGEGHMNYLLANAIAIALCSIANFLVSDEWVFEG